MTMTMRLVGPRCWGDLHQWVTRHGVYTGAQDECQRCAAMRIYVPQRGRHRRDS